MYSSDQNNGRNFFIGLSVAAGITLMALWLLTWVWDPTGALGPMRGAPQLCADGVKMEEDELVVQALGLKAPVDNIFVGSSRFKQGLSAEELPLPATQTHLNLAVAGMRMEDAHRILMPLLGAGAADRIWLGLDYGGFTNPERDRYIHVDPQVGQFNTLARFRVGVFSLGAVRAAVTGLLDGKSCQVLQRGPQGFNRRVLRENGARQLARKLARQLRRRENSLRESLALGSMHGPLYQARLDLLAELVAAAGDTGTQLNVLINPSTPAYFRVLEEAGVDQLVTRWRRDIQGIFAAHQDQRDTTDAPANIQFIDFLDLYRKPAADAGSCKQHIGKGCPFRDLTHYNPWVGSALIASFVN